MENITASSTLSTEQQKELTAIKAHFIQLVTTIMDENPFNLVALYPETDDIQILCEQLTDLKNCLDSFRPLSPVQIAHLNEIFDTEYTYESNRIEGNTLTLIETDLIINKGMTVSGKKMQGIRPTRPSRLKYPNRTSLCFLTRIRNGANDQVDKSY